MSAEASLPRRAVAEALGTGLLLLAIVGSGIAAHRLTDDAALTLLVHAAVIGLALAAAIIAVGPISGAHLNPAVTISVAMQRGIPPADAALYICAQFVGALAGVVGANLMFELPAIAIAETARTGTALWLSEFLATCGLLAVVWGAERRQAGASAAAAVGAYVTAAIWFTSSTAFANPAVTVGRLFTDTFSGIAPLDAVPFIAAQLLAALAATMLLHWLMPALPRQAAEAVVPHDPTSIVP